MSSYRQEAIKVSKTSPWSEVFFGHIFGMLRHAPKTQSAENSFVDHFESPQFSILSASEHLKRPEMCPHHQDCFLPGQVTRLEAAPKMFGTTQHPKDHHLKSRNCDFWPTDQTSTPLLKKETGSAEIFLSQNHFI